MPDPGTLRHHGDAVARATGLLRQHGLDPGDHLLTLLPNTPTTFALQVAATLAGVVQVPLPVDLGPSEVAEIAEDARPSLALVDRTVARGVEALDAPVVHLDAEVLSTTAAADPTSSFPLTRPMAYTSGTTGRRKGVHVGVHDEAWGHQVIDDEHRAFDRRHGDRHLVVSPLYHSGPFRFALVTALTGGEVRVLPRFDAREWLETLRTFRPTSLFCVPTHLHRLLALPDLRPDDLASVDLIAHAGAPCPIPLKERVLELAPDGTVWEFYGSTEGQFTVCPPDVWASDPGTVGRARPDRLLEIRGDDGRALPAGEVGTVWVHAPEHARWEYWQAPDRTASVWDGDAFTVGDLGSLDQDGRLTLAGRRGDLVISGGVNVYPAEVERHLLDQPGVAEAVVFGVPDPDWGERVVAAVVPHEGATVRADEVLEELKRRLSAAKVPKVVAVVDDLPRTETGKVRRVGLAAALDLHATDGATT